MKAIVNDKATGVVEIQKKANDWQFYLFLFIYLLCIYDAFALIRGSDKSMWYFFLLFFTK